MAFVPVTAGLAFKNKGVQPLSQRRHPTICRRSLDVPAYMGFFAR